MLDAVVVASSQTFHQRCTSVHAHGRLCSNPWHLELEEASWYLVAIQFFWVSLLCRPAEKVSFVEEGRSLFRPNIKVDMFRSTVPEHPNASSEHVRVSHVMRVHSCQCIANAFGSRPAKAQKFESHCQQIISPADHQLYNSESMAEASAASGHPIGGRRRKAKGPPTQPSLPDLPPLPRGSDSSEELDEEKDAKRLRPTCTTPRSRLQLHYVQERRQPIELM